MLSWLCKDVHEHGLVEQNMREQKWLMPRIIYTHRPVLMPGNALSNYHNNDRSSYWYSEVSKYVPVTNIACVTPTDVSKDK